MARLLLKIWLFTTIKNFPVAKNLKINLKFCQLPNKPSKDLTKVAKSHRQHWSHWQVVSLIGFHSRKPETLKEPSSNPTSNSACEWSLWKLLPSHVHLHSHEAWSVWPHWAIYWTLGKFLKPLATIILSKSPTFLGNFCIGVKIYHFSSEIIFGQLL